jgi:hypothetical protein
MGWKLEGTWLKVLHMLGRWRELRRHPEKVLGLGWRDRDMLSMVLHIELRLIRLLLVFHCFLVHLMILNWELLWVHYHSLYSRELSYSY